MSERGKLAGSEAVPPAPPSRKLKLATMSRSGSLTIASMKTAQFSLL